MKKSSVAIVIPTYNDRGRLQKCLDAIKRQSFSLEYVTVYVVDNNSTQDIQGLVSQYSFCEYLHETAPGAYNARNKALSALKEEHYVGFTDADCIPDFCWIESAVNMLKQDSNLAIGGQVSVFTEQTKINLYERYEMLYAFPQEIYIQSDHFAVTANLFTTRAVIEKIGLFNTDLFSGGDAEWGNRMAYEDVKLVYSAKVIVSHPARDSLVKLTSKVKRTVGGCYQQRQVNPIMANSFSVSSIVKGYIPPARAIKKLFSSGSECSFVETIKMMGLLTWLKYHKNTLKILYKLGVFKEFERF